MNNKELIARSQHDPCPEAKDWLADKSVKTAWATCRRPDWMLWALHNLPHKPTKVPPRWVLCCLTEELFRHEAFTGRQVWRVYRAVVTGVKAWLSRQSGDEAELNRLKMRVDRGESNPYLAYFVSLCATVPYWDDPRGTARYSVGWYSLALSDEDEAEDGYLSVSVQKNLCDIIREYVPEFPV